LFFKIDCRETVDFFCLSLSFSFFLCTFALSMNESVKFKDLIVFFIIGGGLLYITESWLMALGIMILLILIDVGLADYIVRRREKKEQEDNDETVD